MARSDVTATQQHDCGMSTARERHAWRHAKVTETQQKRKEIGRDMARTTVGGNGSKTRFRIRIRRDATPRALIGDGASHGRNGSPWARLAAQVAKFGVVGVIAFVIDYGVLMLLSQVIGIDPVIAAGISFVVSTVFNYFASMRFVFSHREGMSRRREFVTFVVLSVIGLGLNEVIMAIGTSMLGIGAMAVTVTKVVATAIVMVWNFCSRKRWLDGSE